MNRCRIIGGKLKRRFIAAPGISSTRPTSDIVKQSLFNVLVHRFQIDFQKTFAVDLFAGSGSLGIEAISYGCEKVLFIDSNYQAINCIKNNLESLDISRFAHVIKQSAERIYDGIFQESAGGFKNVLIFMDPPYAEKNLLKSQILRFSELFKEKKLFIVAESDEEFNIEGLTSSIATRHGNTVVSVFSKK